MLEGWFSWFILFWVFALGGLVSIGGFFMFRRFLKTMPKNDGKSDQDWEDEYILKAIHLWDNDTKDLLYQLVSPVPDLFREVAKNKIAGKISQLALEEKVERITFDLMIRGYILATPKRDHKFLKKKLESMNIDLKPYAKYF